MGICSERSPVTGFFVCFVGDGTFHDKNEWSQFSVRRIVEPLEEFITVLKGEDGIVEANFGNPGDGAEHEFFDTGLRGRGERDRVAIATEPRCEPEISITSPGSTMSAVSRWRGIYVAGQITDNFVKIILSGFVERRPHGVLMGRGEWLLCFVGLFL